MNKPKSRITRSQIEALLKYAKHIGDTSLASCAMRALDGDSLYHAGLVERCASAYAGARNTADFKAAQTIPDIFEGYK